MWIYKVKKTISKLNNKTLNTLNKYHIYIDILGSIAIGFLGIQVAITGNRISNNIAEQELIISKSTNMPQLYIDIETEQDFTKVANFIENYVGLTYIDKMYSSSYILPDRVYNLLFRELYVFFRSGSSDQLKKYFNEEQISDILSETKNIKYLFINSRYTQLSDENKIKFKNCIDGWVIDLCYDFYCKPAKKIAIYNVNNNAIIANLKVKPSSYLEIKTRRSFSDIKYFQYDFLEKEVSYKINEKTFYVEIGMCDIENLAYIIKKTIANKWGFKYEINYFVTFYVEYNDYEGALVEEYYYWNGNEDNNLEKIKKEDFEKYMYTDYIDQEELFSYDFWQSVNRELKASIR